MASSLTLDNIGQNVSFFRGGCTKGGRDEISTSTCACSGVCLRESGRNACPCRSAQQSQAVIMDVPETCTLSKNIFYRNIEGEIREILRIF